MAGSSIRNSVHRRNHKERAQPLARAKLGLLEKKKDYVLRARDYKSKKERLKRLREKAAFRNKDEFYWGMIKSRTQGGVHVKERDSSKSLGVDEVKLLKSQDAGYVRLAIAKDESKIAALKTQLQILTSLFPSSSSSSPEDDTWSDMGSIDEDADELEDVDMETLIEAGVVTAEKNSNKKGKGKETGEVGRGHVIFTDDRDDFASWKPEANMPSRTQESKAEETEQLDLGWITTNRLPVMQTTKPTKSKAKSQPSAIVSESEEDDDDDEDDDVEDVDAMGESEVDAMGESEVDEKRAQQKRVEAELKIEANRHRKLLLLELQQRLARLTQLRAVLNQINLQKQMMGKGGVIKKKDSERIVLPSLRKGRAAREGKRDDDADDDEGGKVSYSGKLMKWKAERKR